MICIHAKPFVGASQRRSWSHCVVLGAILWAFIAKKIQGLLKIDFSNTPTKGLAWDSWASRGHSVQPWTGHMLSLSLTHKHTHSLTHSLFLARTHAPTLSLSNTHGFGSWSSGFGVWISGFRVQGLRSRVWGSSFMVDGCGFTV